MLNNYNSLKIESFCNTPFKLIFKEHEFATFYILQDEKKICITINKEGEINFSSLAIQLNPMWSYANWQRSRKKRIKLHERLAKSVLTRFVKHVDRKRDFFVFFPLAVILIEEMNPDFCWLLVEAHDAFFELNLDSQ